MGGAKRKMIWKPVAENDAHQVAGLKEEAEEAEEEAEGGEMSESGSINISKIERTRPLFICLWQLPFFFCFFRNGRK